MANVRNIPAICLHPPRLPGQGVSRKAAQLLTLADDTREIKTICLRPQGHHAGRLTMRVSAYCTATRSRLGQQPPSRSERRA